MSKAKSSPETQVEGNFRFKTTKAALPHVLAIFGIVYEKQIVPLTFTGADVRGAEFFEHVRELKKLRADNPVAKATANISRMSPEQVQATLDAIKQMYGEPEVAKKSSPRKPKKAPKKAATKVEAPAPPVEG
jgi:hypothetical protein